MAPAFPALAVILNPIVKAGHRSQVIREVGRLFVGQVRNDALGENDRTASPASDLGKQPGRGGSLREVETNPSELTAGLLIGQAFLFQLNEFGEIDLHPAKPLRQ